MREERPEGAPARMARVTFAVVQSGLRCAVCCLPTGLVAFEGSLASSLRFVRPATSDRELHQAIQLVDLAETVAALVVGKEVIVHNIAVISGQAKSLSLRMTRPLYSKALPGGLPDYSPRPGFWATCELTIHRLFERLPAFYAQQNGPNSRNRQGFSNGYPEEVRQGCSNRAGAADLLAWHSLGPWFRL
jgi:hypothetical protein